MDSCNVQIRNKKGEYMKKVQYVCGEYVGNICRLIQNYKIKQKDIIYLNTNRIGQFTMIFKSNKKIRG